MVVANQLDIVVVKKQDKKAEVMDVTIPGDCNISKKKYGTLKK